MASKKAKLKDMKMPDKRQEEMDMEEMQFDLGEGEEEPFQSEEPSEFEEAAEGEEMSSESSPELEALSDDELMAEVKKRGLMSQLDSEEESAESEELF